MADAVETAGLLDVDVDEFVGMPAFVAADRFDGVEVTVSDTGVGMSAEKAAAVFSIDKKTTTEGTNGEIGTGLGLPLCRELVERNGGEIWIDTALGEGSRFHFTLPGGPPPS